MAEQVVMGATLKCSMAVPPGTTSLIVIPQGKPVSACKKFAATVMDFKPLGNIPPFGMCNAKANPTVIAATAAASGAPTPGACLPVITSPWSPGSPTVKINKFKALNKSSTCNCVYGGTISVQVPGQTTVTVP